MATTIFPQNDPNPADETDFQDWFSAKNTKLNYVANTGDFQINTTSGLDITLFSGTGYLGGVGIEIDGLTLSAPDNDQSILCVTLTRSSGLVQSPGSDEDNFEFVTDPNNITNEHLPLYVITTSSGSITEIGDARWVGPGSVFARKESGSDSVSSTTTLEDMEAMRVPVPYQDQYAQSFEAHFMFDSGIDAGGVKVSPRLLMDTGEIEWTAILWDETPNLVAMDVNVNKSSTLSASGSTSSGLLVIRGAMAIDQPDELRFQWAQDSSNATATQLRSGSYVRIWPTIGSDPESE